jgi:hypothetical protein
MQRGKPDSLTQAGTPAFALRQFGTNGTIMQAELPLRTDKAQFLTERRLRDFVSRMFCPYIAPRFK